MNIPTGGISLPNLDFSPMQRLAKDLANSSKTLSQREARFIVSLYYQMQDNRKRADSQVRALANEPHNLLAWFFEQSHELEKQMGRSLDKYSAAHPVGVWARNQLGIGPVIAAGLLAHIDIHKAPTVGHIWSYAGLNPTSEWKKGEVRPWNAELKTLCWKIGESFVKVHNKPNAYYGHIFAERKALELERNEAKMFADQAKAILERKNIGKTTDAYKAYSQGYLPPAHIHSRAKRYAVKLFLSHLHEVWYRHEFKKDPPLPYAIAYLDHVHKIDVPTGE